MAKTVIIGGVAGGAGAAARLRRLDESMEIILFERGEYISFANCGLPYYIGDVIKERSNLLVTPEAVMKGRYHVDVRTFSEVTKIDRDKKTVTVQEKSGKVYVESYDELIIATGSSPIRPRIEGIDLPGIYTLWNISDTDRIRSVIDVNKPKRAVVIGGGFIGLEMAENLHMRGIDVSIIEAQDQVMAPLDHEMAQILHQEIKRHNVDLNLSDGVKCFRESDNGIEIVLASEKVVEADMVLLSIGVLPNSKLAREAGLTLNERGGIIVSDEMQTSDDHIWAVGDVIQIKNFVTGEPGMIPLAGPANKQARLVAGQIASRYNSDLSDLKYLYHGTQGTSVAKVFDLAAATVGINEKVLMKQGKVKGTDYETLLIVSRSHAGYYPDSKQLYIKCIFTLEGKILGAQVIGEEGADKRIDVIATVMRLNGSVSDLKELELAYAPPFSSAKDPVNMAGFVAENILNGLVVLRMPDEVDALKDGIILDVREDMEVAQWKMENEIHIPLGSLRSRITELDNYKDKEICVLCAGGVRAYNAARILNGYGFKKVSVVAGGAGFYRLVKGV